MIKVFADVKTALLLEGCIGVWDI